MEKVKSLSFVYYAPGDVRLEERQINFSSTDLLVKIHASARCGTDKTIFYHGHYKVDANAPIILGHELTGEIIKVGKDVKSLTEGIGYKSGKTLSPEYLDFHEGERITTQSRIARHSDNGLMLLTDPVTILSFYINGGYSQYMRVPAELIQSGSVLRLPESVSNESGALVEPAACALESIYASPRAIGVDNDGRHIFHGGVRKGGKACVFGSGSISLVYALLCKLEGSSEIYLVVRSEAKAEKARKLLGNNFKVIVIPPYDNCEINEKIRIEDDIVKNFTALTNGTLFDDVAVACPSTDAQRLMLRLYNPEGYGVGACFGGTHQTVDRADIDKNHYCAAKTIGTSGCSTKTMERIIQLMNEGKLSLEGFTDDKKYTFKDDPEEFFTTTSAGLKPVLYPWE